jgi:hypothetical protein
LAFGGFQAIEEISIIHKSAGFICGIPAQWPLLVCEVSAMSQDKAIPISVIALRADDYSLDGKDVIISLTTKYSAAERKYSVPVECFHDLIVDLQRLNAAATTTAIETPIQPAVAPNPADDLNRLTIAA